MSRPAGASWNDWWRVGCGVESLHDVLVQRGMTVTLDDLLAQALAEDGYLDDVGWRHHALVAVAARHGVGGQVCPPLTVDDIMGADAAVDWVVSVRAPEQFGATTHLVHARRAETPDAVEIFWPQGELEFGERFVVPVSWLGARMTGRGMRFDRIAPCMPQGPEH